MRDAHQGEYRKMTVQRAFELSLNTGISLAVTKAYAKDPKRFLDGLKRFGLHEPTGVMIPVSRCPLRGPGRKGWSGVSLPWMSIGYESMLTPLQTSDFLQRRGEQWPMMQPQFVDHVSRNGKVVERMEPKVMNPRICSKSTLDVAHAMLQAVVDSGTATNLKAAHFKIAGKTGTAQISRNGSYKTEGVSYQASFVGLFPGRCTEVQLHRGGERTNHERHIWQRGGRSGLQGDRRQDLQQSTGAATGNATGCRRGATYSGQYEWS
jgi:cell division protein FtsI (penicillin-binding protein 3)